MTTEITDNKVEAVSAEVDSANVEQSAVAAEVAADVPLESADVPAEVTAEESDKEPTDEGDELEESLKAVGFDEEAIGQFEKDLLETGDLSEDSYAKLAEKGLDGLAKVYLKSLREMQAKVAEQSADESQVAAVEEYNSKVTESNERILAELGGMEAVDELISFKNTLSPSDIAEFNAKAEQLGEVALQAFIELKQKYIEKYGTATLTNTNTVEVAAEPAEDLTDVFASEKEYALAMNDKRYSRDFKYVTYVREKLLRSVKAGTVSL